MHQTHIIYCFALTFLLFLPFPLSLSHLLFTILTAPPSNCSWPLPPLLATLPPISCLFALFPSHLSVTSHISQLHNPPHTLFSNISNKRQWTTIRIRIITTNQATSSSPSTHSLHKTQHQQLHYIHPTHQPHPSSPLPTFDFPAKVTNPVNPHSSPPSNPTMALPSSPPPATVLTPSALILSASPTAVQEAMDQPWLTTVTEVMTSHDHYPLLAQQSTMHSVRLVATTLITDTLTAET